VSDLLTAQPAPLHAGEAETSVLLHLHPELVHMDRARDFELAPEEFDRYLRGLLPAPPPGGAGVVGHPTAATADKGRQIYARILHAVRLAVFHTADAAAGPDAS